MVTAWLRDAWRFLQTGQGLGVLGVVSFFLVVVVYAGLASRFPGVGLLATSLLTFAAVLVGTFAAWPVEKKITLQRQAEVVTYRVLVALAAYLAVGIALLWLVNRFTGYVIPLDWPGNFLTRVPFWPFYALVTVGCQLFLPVPPDAC